MSQSKLNNPTTIYALIDPRDNRVRYVGKTIQKVEGRLRHHIKSAKSKWGKKTYSRNWIKSLLACGERPVVKTLIVVHGDSWVWWERFFIKWFREIEHDLTNHCDGGEGAPRESKCIDVPCSRCGVRTRKKPHEIKDWNHNYCSRLCSAKHRAEIGLSGGRPKSPRVSFQCECCGSVFSLTESRAKKGKNRFCSMACRDRSGFSPRRKFDSNKLSVAKKMREDGRFYREIASFLGVSIGSARQWIARA